MYHGEICGVFTDYSYDALSEIVNTEQVTVQVTEQVEKLLGVMDDREVLDPAIRWTERLQLSSGEWSGNLFDFYFGSNYPAPELES